MIADKQDLKIELDFIVTRSKLLADEMQEIARNLECLEGADRVPELEFLVFIQRKLLALSIRSNSISTDLAREAADTAMMTVKQTKRAVDVAEVWRGEWGMEVLLNRDAEGGLQ